MKTMKLYMLAILLVAAFSTNAQVAVKVDRTYGAPKWAPTAPAKTNYYYLPDIQTYYDVPAQRYIYQKNGTWTRTAVLPARYSGYDLYKGKTVYLTDYKGKTPYTYYSTHKAKYKGNKAWKKNGHDNGNHYGQLKNKRNDHDNGHGNGNGNGKGHGKGKGKK